MVDTVWSEAQRQLRGALAGRDFEFWIAPLRDVGWDDRDLTLEVPSAFARDWIAREYLALISRAVSLCAGREAGVKLVINRQLAPAVPERRGPQQVVPSPAGDPADGPARFTFDTFVVGATNQVAYQAARAVVEAPGQRYNPLFIHGGFGLGKTHLLSAISHAVGTARRSGGVACVTAERFVNDMVAALRRDQMDRFRHRYRGISILVVDDVQFLGGKKRSQEEFAHTFNALHELGKQIVLASDRPPHELPDMEDTLRSRFASGLLVDVLPPDAALRRSLVETKAKALGLALQPAAARYLADEWCRNVRQLEGSLTRLAFETPPGRMLTVTAARAALAAYVPGARSEVRASVARIIGEVCRHYRLSASEIASSRRTARVTVPRQVAMYLCRRHTDAPLQAIGAELGGRDHTTVMHALGAVERRLAGDADLRSAVDALEARLTG
jgi:chromosomal replication initiator protein